MRCVSSPIRPSSVILTARSADSAGGKVQEVIAFGTQVGVEDLALCEAVQTGLDSRAVPQGRLMRESEQLIHDFQRKVVTALLG
jgi:Ring hydroxylating alpha subunit (catalytic domain)